MRLKPSSPVLIRRVVGESMLPYLKPNHIVLIRRTQDFKVNDLVVFYHQGLEKIKRVDKIKHKKIYVLGSNLEYSLDSREYGWINRENILGKLIWPKIIF